MDLVAERTNWPGLRSVVGDACEALLPSEKLCFLDMASGFPMLEPG